MGEESKSKIQSPAITLKRALVARRVRNFMLDRMER
jgi:hypothetical protein